MRLWECGYTSYNSVHEKLTQIRVSTANCCDLCTEDSFEEDADVKPFTGGESACWKLSGNIVCVERSSTPLACWHRLHITSRPGRGLTDGFMSALANALIGTVNGDVSEVLTSRDWVTAAAGSDTEYTTAARGNGDCIDTRTVFEHSDELPAWSTDSKLNCTLCRNSVGSWICTI